MRQARRPLLSAIPSALMLLLLLALVATAADTVLTMQHALQTLNLGLTRDTYSLVTPWLTWPMILFTILGEDPPLDLFALVVAFLAARRGNRRDMTLLIAVAITARLVGVAMKYVVAQPRPFLRRPPQPLGVLHGYGYPSGHAILSMSILGFGAIVLAWLLRGSRWRWPAVVVLALLIGAIGLSRVYLGFHWVNDVVGGYLEGSVIVLLACTLRSYLGRVGGARGWLASPPLEQHDRPRGADSEPAP